MIDGQERNAVQAMQGARNESTSRVRSCRLSCVGNVTWSKRLRICRARAEFAGCPDFFGTCPRLLSRNKPRGVFQSDIASHATFAPGGVSVQLEANSRCSMEAGWVAVTCDSSGSDHVPIS